jgi:adenine-specific DNA glycosylase
MEFFRSYKELLNWVGEYTAAAIAFSYNEAVPVVDGNVLEYYLVILILKLILLWSAKKKEFALVLRLMPRMILQFSIRP